LKAVTSNFLVLERGVTMAVNVSGIPERTVEFPKEVDEFTNPESAGEITVINHQCEKKRVLDLGTFARESSTEQLAPSE
jgi:hypothetical protein